MLGLIWVGSIMVNDMGSESGDSGLESQRPNPIPADVDLCQVQLKMDLSYNHTIILIN